MKPLSIAQWDDLQFVVGQLHKLPLLDEVEVSTGLTIGPRAKKPLHLNIPLFVSDMSYGALSEEAKVALATPTTARSVSRRKNRTCAPG